MYFYLFIPQVCCENGRGERLYHSLWFVELFKSNKGEVLKTCSDNTGCCSKVSPGSLNRWNVMAEIASYAVGRKTRQIVRNVVLTEWQRPTLNSMQTCATTCVSSVAELRECPKMKDITTNIYIYTHAYIYVSGFQPSVFRKAWILLISFTKYIENTLIEASIWVIKTDSTSHIDITEIHNMKNMESFGTSNVEHICFSLITSKFRGQNIYPFHSIF